MQPDATYGSTVPIDRAHLQRYTLGDAGLELEILTLFIGQAPLTHAALTCAATAHDWSMAAHSLKGSARAVGATQVADLAERAETLSFADRKARDDVLQGLAAAIDTAEHYIRGLSRAPLA
jgi:HPt (histidine-containing phosphotransfer) domain-containing protein